MTVKRTIYILLVLTAIGVAFALNANRQDKGAETRAAAPARAPQGGAPLPVYTETIQPRLLTERITATGSIVADEAVELVSEVSGKVVSIAFEEGSAVKRGDLLLKINDEELAAQAARAESRVVLARAQAARQNQLVAAGGTSREALDAAESEVRVLESEATLARAQLAKTEIRAPFDGVIGLRYVSVGAYIDSAARIATLQKVDTIKIDFSIAERHLDRIQPGAQVEVSVAGVAERFTGAVYAIEPRIDPGTRTLRLRARSANPGGKVLPGGFATVEMALRTIPDALLVPADAIVSGLNNQRVYVLENGLAQERKVQTGLRLSREVQIVSGLEPGAIVITSGQLQLRPGVPVQAVKRGQSGQPAPSTAPVTEKVAATP
jgi:membrane fusion protein (multidrug efflux system)